MFIRLLTSIINASYQTKYVSLSNQQCMTGPTLINLDHKEYSQGLCHHSPAVNLDWCRGHWNTLNDLSNKVFVPNNTEDLELASD